MKIEVVITVWDDGLFKLRDSISATDFFDASEAATHKLAEMQARIELEEEHKHKIMEDDDIPF